MSLSAMVVEWAAAEEQERGRKPTDLALQIAEHILQVGDMLTEQGRKDAREGKCAYSATVFPFVVVTAFGMNVGEEHDVVQVVADLWQTAYMAGYEEGNWNSKPAAL